MGSGEKNTERTNYGSTKRWEISSLQKQQLQQKRRRSSFTEAADSVSTEVEKASAADSISAAEYIRRNSLRFSYQDQHTSQQRKQIQHPQMQQQQQTKQGKA